jgi:hypothetical protein
MSGIHRNEGVTAAENYLKRLCEKTFLSLWCYPNIHRNEGRSGSKHEVCDLLVVFEDHIIIFSDKDCEFPNTGDLKLDWNRWYKKAIRESAKQALGAEKWIKENPNTLFLDPACMQPFPIPLPDLSIANFHKIIVAHGVSDRCKQELGGSGSFMIMPDIIGDMHIATAEHDAIPFAIGQIDPRKGFIHVLDDTSLDIVMSKLDTISDFVGYLDKKEKFILNGRLAMAAGEEELLAYYLRDLNDEDEHDFILPETNASLALDEGHWTRFEQSSARKRQIQEDKISYVWDTLIERFNEHILNGTQYHTTHPGVEHSERIMRFLAKESRFSRRYLSRTLMEIIAETKPSQRRARVVKSLGPKSPIYIFLLLPHLNDIPDDVYREGRMKFLEAYCLVTKLKMPDAEDIIGIATESGNSADMLRSEDALYYDARNWTEEEESEAKNLQDDLGLLVNYRTLTSHEEEYPNEIRQPRFLSPQSSRQIKVGRNQPCTCGSGKKFKKCCGM